MLKRGDKNDNVLQIQRRLQALGFLTESTIQTGAGRFGPATETALRQYFQSLANGKLTPAHLGALFPHDKYLPNFIGDVAWVHALEGHAGKAYWPKGMSGVTLDPGCDLGYIEPELFKDVYELLLTPKQLEVCLDVISRKLRGNTANDELKANVLLRSIRISRADADSAFPMIASKYWQGISKRFPTLKEKATPPAVQSALLSIAYNRGVSNKGLEVLAEPLRARRWAEVAKLIGSMQQDHKLSGIRQRRRKEANYITNELQG